MRNAEDLTSDQRCLAPHPHVAALHNVMSPGWPSSAPGPCLENTCHFSPPEHLWFSASLSNVLRLKTKVVSKSRTHPGPSHHFPVCNLMEDDLVDQVILSLRWYCKTKPKPHMGLQQECQNHSVYSRSGTRAGVAWEHLERSHVGFTGSVFNMKRVLVMQ